MTKYFNLQMFAETEAATSAAASTATAETAPEKTTNAKEPGGATKTEPKAEAKYTDADLDRIISKKFAEMQSKKEKEVAEAKKLAEMNAQEQAEYKLQEANKRIAEFERKEALAEMTKTARAMLADSNITVSDDLLAMMVSTDAATTKAAIDSFTKMYNEAVENKVKERLRGETPKRGSASDIPVSEIQKRINKYS